MKTFNAFQLVTLFASWPFLIAWLSTQDNFWAKPLTVAAGLIYMFGFVPMIIVVEDGLEKYS